jgi:hypothetical protein
MRSGDATRWLAVGTSANSDSYEAGVEAATAALAAADPKLVVVFCADGYDLNALLSGLNTTTGGVPLIGCSTAGEISTGGPNDQTVVVTILGGAGFDVATKVTTGVTGRHREAGAEVATCATQVADSSEHRVLMLLSDGLVRRQEEIIRGIYGALGASVPLVGGCAGDDLKMEQTFVFCDDEVLQDAIVAAAVGSDAPFGIGLHHGWSKVGEPVIVTNSADSLVHRFGDEPALDVYLRRLNAPAEAYEDPAAFTRFALLHPLALSRRGGEEMRFIAEADFEQRALVCVADVPQGALVWFTEGDAASVLDASDAACQSAIDMLDGPPIGLLAFDCIARRGVLGDSGIRQEVGRIARHGAPVAGFYTYGEFARIRGSNGFHNQTLVVLAVG